jgi:drug/metabolite transporter (DMT)-like permease
MSTGYTAERAQESISDDSEKSITSDATPIEAPAGNRIQVLLALFSVYVIWGSTYLGIRYALEGFPPFMMGGIRFIIAGGLLYLFTRARGTPNPSRREWGGAAIVGALLLAGGNGGVSFAQKSEVASSVAALVVATTPVWAALFAGFWGRWPNRLEWLGLGLGLVGVALLNLEGNLQANPLGAAAVLFAAVSWAFGSMLSRHISLPSGLMGAAIEMLAGGAILFGISLMFGETISHFPSDVALWALVYLIVFGSLVAYSAYTYLLSHVRPVLATSYAYVNPVVAVALGVGLAGEQITAIGIVAMLVILVAVALVVLGREQLSGKE